MTKHKNNLLFPYLVIFYEIALYLSYDMYVPSMPTIAKDLFFTEQEIDYSLAIWFLGASLFQVVLGPLSDRYGRRIIILSGAIFFTISSIVCALAYSLNVLLVARFVQGTAICTLVAAFAAVHELYSTKKAIKILAMIGAVTILAPAFGPLLGSLIVEFANWRYIFWFLVVMGIISCISLYCYMPETNKEMHNLNIKRIVNNYLKILCNPDFLVPCGSYFFLVSVQFIWIYKSPFIMIEVYNTSTLFYGFAQTMIFSCFFVGAIATKWLLDRYSVERLVFSGLGITVFGAIMFWFDAKLYPTIEMAILCMMIISLGSSMLFGTLNRAAIESCKQPIGMISALLTTSTSISGLLSGVAWRLVNNRSLFTVASLSLVCVMLASILIIKMKIPEPTEEAI